jgi:histone H3/H4
MSEKMEGRISAQEAQKAEEEKVMREAIEVTAKMLKAEAENTGKSWKEGDPVYINSAGSDHADTHTGKSHFFIEQAGISSWQNTDIANKYHESIEAALGEITERAKKDAMAGARVTIEPYGMSYSAEFPEENK